MSPDQLPVLSGIVVHWHNETELESLAQAWPQDPRFELVVVDNGSSRPLQLPAATRLVQLDGNLGFAGGVNLGAQVASGRLLLLLNPDAEPLTGALEALVEGFEALPLAAGLVPTLLGGDGKPQTSWQARPLPTTIGLILQPLLGDRRRGATQLEVGARVDQPAAAALALRRELFEALGGFDPRFRPAWFEDVDFGARAQRARQALLAWPHAEFRHGLGSSVPRLGYGRFLIAYHHNLERYLQIHAGGGAPLAARVVLVLGLLLRFASLAVRVPQRAHSRAGAARGLGRCLLAALSGWRRPREALS